MGRSLEGQNINIHITGQRVVNNIFYKLICEGKVYNNGIKLCDQDVIIKNLLMIII